MTTEHSQPPPLDPALVLRARVALNAAGLPGDAVGDVEVAGLVVEMGLINIRISVRGWWVLEDWWKARKSR